MWLSASHSTSQLFFLFQFHNTFGTGVANSTTALSAGIRTLDSSTGGLGGCPYSPVRLEMWPQKIFCTHRKASLTLHLETPRLLQTWVFGYRESCGVTTRVEWAMVLARVVNEFVGLNQKSNCDLCIYIL